jgi:hypothetical protein
VAIGGGVSYRWMIHEKNSHESRQSQQAYQLVCSDLLYLENFQTMKITQDEANSILPLMDQLAASTDPNVQSNLTQEIYGDLNPQQYAALLQQQNTNNQKTVKGKDEERGHAKEGKAFKGDRQFKNGSSIREQALGNVVQKMLTDRSQGKA